LGSLRSSVARSIIAWSCRKKASLTPFEEERAGVDIKLAAEAIEAVLKRDG
jgi:hypothetical protein